MAISDVSFQWHNNCWKNPTLDVFGRFISTWTDQQQLDKSHELVSATWPIEMAVEMKSNQL